MRVNSPRKADPFPLYVYPASFLAAPAGVCKPFSPSPATATATATVTTDNLIFTGEAWRMRPAGLQGSSQLRWHMRTALSK